MRVLEKLEGIIIRTQDYGETHKIVTIFTKELGKIAVIARGAKKPKSRMSALAQLFIHGQFLIQLGKGLGVLQQGEIIQSHRLIRQDIIQAAYASYLTELTDKLMDDKKPNHYIYQQFSLALKSLSEDKDPLVMTMMYEMKLYKISGIAPIVSHCYHCGSEDSLLGFSIKEAGVICARCKHHDPSYLPLTNMQLRLLRMFSDVDIERVANVSVKEENKKVLQHVLEYYYDHYGGLTIKSKKFLKQLHLLTD